MAVQSVYHAVFTRATTRKWFSEVYDMPEMIACVREIMDRAGLDKRQLDSRLRLIDESVDVLDAAIDFFDMVRFLRHCFHGVSGSPSALLAKAAVQKLASAWPLTLTPDTLRLAKGLAQHLADGVAPKDISETELSCLILRPVLAPGMPVVSTGTGYFGRVESADSDSVRWIPSGDSVPTREQDIYTIISLVPLVDGIPTGPKDPFPRVAAADVFAEFEAVFA